MKIYVARMSEEWNPDFLVATANLETMVEILCKEVFEEDYIYLDKEEMVKNLKERENNHYVNLLDIEDFEEIPEDWGLSIEVTPLEGYKK